MQGLRPAHTRGHVAGACSGDMLQRQFSSCNIPVLLRGQNFDPAT